MTRALRFLRMRAETAARVARYFFGGIQSAGRAYSMRMNRFWKLFVTLLLSFCIVGGLLIMAWGVTGIRMYAEAFKNVRAETAGFHTATMRKDLVAQPWRRLGSYDVAFTRQPMRYVMYNEALAQYLEAVAQRRLPPDYLSDPDSDPWRKAVDDAQASGDHYAASRAAFAAGTLALQYFFVDMSVDPKLALDDLARASQYLARALEEDPMFEDAKWNLEIVLKISSALQEDQGEGEEGGTPDGEKMIGDGAGSGAFVPGQGY